VNTVPMIVRGKSAEQVNDGPQSAITLFLDDPDTAGSVTVNRSFLGAGSAGAPAHEHRHASKTIFVIDGFLRVLLERDVHTLTAGDLVHFPPGTTHAFAPPTGRSADLIAFFTPGQERFAYYRMLEQLHDGEITLSQLQATSDRFDNHYVTSPNWQTRLPQ